MKAILSTRILDKTQETRLKNAGIAIESYDAIHIQYLDNEIPEGYNHLIFTSKNGVKGYLRNLNTSPANTKDITCFCVGEKTKSFLEEIGFFVGKMAQNSSQLGEFIAEKGKKGPFLIFTGNRNRPELRKILEENEIPFREVMVYETVENPKKFDKAYQCILFYSPSGVHSFITANSPNNAMAICIGETTAREARKHFQTVLVAETPTTDNVIDTLIKNYPILANS